MDQRRLRTRLCFLAVIALPLAYLAVAWFSSKRLEFQASSHVGIGELQEAATVIELRLATFGFQNARVRVHRAGRLRVTYDNGQAVDDETTSKLVTSPGRFFFGLVSLNNREVLSKTQTSRVVTYGSEEYRILIPIHPNGADLKVGPPPAKLGPSSTLLRLDLGPADSQWLRDLTSTKYMNRHLVVGVDDSVLLFAGIAGQLDGHITLEFEDKKELEFFEAILTGGRLPDGVLLERSTRGWFF